MKDEKVFEVRHEIATKVGIDLLNGLTFNGGVSEFILTLQAKIALQKGLPIDAISIKSFSIKKTDGKIPAYFDCLYDEVIRYDKKDLEARFREAVNARGCKLTSVIFNDGSAGHLVLNVEIPESMRNELEKPYGNQRFLGEIKGDVTGFYACTFMNVKYV